MKRKYRTTAEKCKSIIPIVISVCGIMLSVSARMNALIIPEIRCSGIHIAAWSFAAVIAIAHFFGVLLPDDKKLNDFKRIESMVILSVIFILVVFPRVADVETLFISGIETSSEIGLLCFLAVVFAAVGDMKSTRLLVLGILVCAIIGRVCGPPICWDITTCSIEVFRSLFLSELLIPVFIISVLPAAAGECCFGLNEYRCIYCKEHKLLKKDIRSARIIQIILCLLSGLFTLLSRSEIKEETVYIIMLIITASIISEIMGMRNYNGLMVALPVFIKLFYDINTNELIVHSNYHEIYIAFGVIALFASIRVKKNVFLFTESAYLVVLITELLSYSGRSVGYGIEEYSNVLTLYGAEVLMCLAFLLFAFSDEWSENIIHDLSNWIFMPAEEETDIS